MHRFHLSSTWGSLRYHPQQLYTSPSFSFHRLGRTPSLAFAFAPTSASASSACGIGHNNNNLWTRLLATKAETEPTPLRRKSRQRVKENELNMEPPPTRKLQRQNVDISHSEFKFFIGAHEICHPDKVAQGGEDAHIILSERHLRKEAFEKPHREHHSSFQPIESDGETVLAIFDGVGSLSFEKNINVRAFANGMYPFSMNEALQQTYIKAKSSGVHANIDPYELLSSAFNEVRKRGIEGSSTACVLALNHDRLSCASLGDSGFILLRPTQKVVTAILQPVISQTKDVNLMIHADITKEALEHPTIQISPVTLPVTLLPSPMAHKSKAYTIVYRSPQQLLYFNCPAALGVNSTTAPTSDNTNSSEERSSPYIPVSNAIRLQLQLEEGDIIILASDGLFDNVFEEDIVQIVGSVLGELDDREINAEATQKCAETLAKRAYELSLSKTVDCPFALAAKESNILWSGGRKDDITVLISAVVSSNR